MGKRYFTDGNDKFWEIWADGKTIYTRHGKIGASGQTKLETAQKGMSSVDTRIAEKIAEKVKQGFVEPAAAKAVKPKKRAKVVVPEGAFRLELGDKFFQILRADKTVTTWSGGIDDDKVKPAKKKHKDEWEARRDVDEQIAKKVAAGFDYYLPGVTYDASATNPELDKQVANDPSDDSFAVYADWLQEQGDPRGDLAVLQARRAKKPNDKRLADEEKKLLWKERGRYYGPLAPFVVSKPPKYGNVPVTATWRHGWIDELVLSSVSTYGDLEIPRVKYAKDLVELLPRVASARLLRSLVIGPPNSDDNFDFEDVIEAVAKHWPPTLRELEIGRFTGEDCEVSWSTVGSLAPIWKKADKLEKLVVKGGSFKFGTIVAPALRSFSVITGGLAKKEFKAILAAKWPKLERLEIWFGQPEYGCDIKPADLAPLWSIDLPKLDHLAVANTIWGDEIVPLLAKAPILRKLSSLDLSGSHLTIQGIEKMVEHKDAFAHLESLDLHRCLLDAKAQKLAKTVVKNVNLERQWNLSDYQPEEGEEKSTWWRYSRLGE